MAPEVLKNILTFGAQSRVRRHHDHYTRLLEELKGVSESTERDRERTTASLTDLHASRTRAVDCLRGLRPILKHLRVNDRLYETIEVTEESALEIGAIEPTLSATEVGLNSLKSLAAGVSAGAGTWGLVGALGAASTGTSISALSGAAATNATLAWLGGGSLASGGAGMAGGTLVLGGIVAVPALALSAALSHLSANRQIKKIEEACATTVIAMGELRALSLRLEALRRRATEIDDGVQKATTVCSAEIDAATRSLFPHGWLSRLYRRVRSLIGWDYYTEADMPTIARLLAVAREVAKLIDLPVAEAAGQKE